MQPTSAFLPKKGSRQKNPLDKGMKSVLKDPSQLKPISKTNKVRSKSANTQFAHSAKIVLPSLQPISGGKASNDLDVMRAHVPHIPNLQLRFVHSAPAVSRSTPNLTPILPTKNRSSSIHLTTSKSVYSIGEGNQTPCSPYPHRLQPLRKGTLGAGIPQRRPSFEECEQAGGILAPRKE